MVQYLFFVCFVSIRCKWPGCQKASVVIGDLIKHIRVVHLKWPLRKTKEQEDDRNPRDYIETIDALLTEAGALSPPKHDE